MHKPWPDGTPGSRRIVHICFMFLWCKYLSLQTKSNCKLSECWSKVVCGMSQSLALVGHLAIINHMCKIIIGQITFGIRPLFILFYLSTWLHALVGLFFSFGKQTSGYDKIEVQCNFYRSGKQILNPSIRMGCHYDSLLDVIFCLEQLCELGYRHFTYLQCVPLIHPC